MTDGELRVSAAARRPAEVTALHGLVRSLLANMVKASPRDTRRASRSTASATGPQKQGNDLELAVGFSHPVKKTAPQGIEFEVPQPTRITVRGIDKELVGQVAAEIRAIKKPEPYKAKGIRYEGEHIRRKGGKAAKAGARSVRTGDDDEQEDS